MRTTIAALALLSACTQPTEPRRSLPPMRAHAAKSAPTLAVAPASLTLAVGETATAHAVFSGYKRTFTGFFWGCAGNDCYSVVSILPASGTGRPGDPLAGESAAVTGVRPGVVQVYVTDGLGLWATMTVTVTQ